MRSEALALYRNNDNGGLTEYVLKRVEVLALIEISESLQTLVEYLTAARTITSVYTDEALQNKE